MKRLEGCCNHCFTIFHWFSNRPCERQQLLDVYWGLWLKVNHMMSLEISVSNGTLYHKMQLIVNVQPPDFSWKWCYCFGRRYSQLCKSDCANLFWYICPYLRTLTQHNPRLIFVEMHRYKSTYFHPEYSSIFLSSLHGQIKRSEVHTLTECSIFFNSPA